MIGKTLTHYTITGQLGAGGMGVVYRARDERLNRDIALKVLPAALLSDDAARARFRQEAMALSRLNHPNIATVHDFNSEDGVDFLVMEHVEGETLAHRLSRGPLPEPEAVALGVQIAEALEEAHERGVIHRDLKPGNVIVGPKGRAKVLDFGLAKLLQFGEGIETASVTATGTWSGTLPYMPPEQVEGHATDERSDLYALGAILYEMAAGRRAFPATGAARLFSSILNDRPAPPSSVSAGISPDFDAIVLRLLEKEPERRFASARELIGSLQAVGKGSTRTAAPRAAAGSARDGSSAARAEGPRIEGLVVLPLENLSGDPEQEYFADGMTEELIADLAQIQALRVISRTSAMRYKGTRKTMEEIGRELNVDAVVEGSVRRHGDRVRITAQLIEVATDRHLWAKSYERDLRDVLSLQGEVAQAIAQEIQVKLTPMEEARFARARKVDPRAYEAYLKGRHFWSKRTDETLLKSLEYFREAIDLDPTWATARVGLADAYNILGFFGTLPPADSFPKAKAAAAAALEIDEGMAEAYTAVAYAQHYYDWDWKGADQSFRRALELNEGNAYTHLFYLNYFMAMGKFDEAVRESDRALELDPLSMIINAARGWVRYFGRDFDGAVQYTRRTLEMEPDFLPARVWLAWIYEAKGMWPEALAEALRAAEITGSGPWALSALGRIQARMGKTAEAEGSLRQLLDLSSRRYVSPYDIAIVQIALGRPDDAFEQLEKAYRGRANYLALMRVDPRLDPLRSDPRFADLERRMNFPPGPPLPKS